MRKAMTHGFSRFLAATLLLAGSTCWFACGSDGGSDSSIQAAPPPGGGGPPPSPSPIGWTALNPSSDSRLVYVSSSSGSDANSGLSEAAPKATLAAGKALMRTGMPDWLQLKAGDTWTNQNLGNWNLSGRSLSEPMVITSYGSGARPRILTGTSNGIQFFGANSISNVSIVGLHFEAHTFTGSQGSTGVFCLDDRVNFLIEDCFIKGYSDNLVVQGATNFRLRRSVIVDSYSTVSHSQGIYAEGIDGLLVEECVFDHNGWNADVAGAEEVIFNHNIYVQSDCLNVTIRGNIVARASSHGLQLRPGGTAQENLFLQNAIAMFAAGEGAGPLLTSVENNVVLDGKDIDGSPRGSGIEVFDSRNALVKNNVVAHKPPGVGDQQAYMVEGQHDDAMGVPYVIVFEDNIAYEWNGSALSTEDTYTSLTVRNNIFQDLSNAQQMIDIPAIHGFEVFQNNLYTSSRALNQWFSVGASQTSLAGWVTASSESGAQALQVTFPDPDRTMATYNASLGGTATLGAFLAEARLQSKANWRTEYTADAANDYIRAGFGR